MYKKFGEIDERFDHMDERFENIEGELTVIRSKVSGVNDLLHKHIQSTDERLNEAFQLIGRYFNDFTRKEDHINLKNRVSRLDAITP